MREIPKSAYPKKGEKTSDWIKRTTDSAHKALENKKASRRNFSTYPGGRAGLMKQEREIKDRLPGGKYYKA
jgi:hypothetical protein